MSAAHTPGPWEIVSNKSGISVYPSYKTRWRSRITQIPVWSGTSAREEADANARLIAAAPDLLEALQMLQLQALQSPDLLATEWGQEALAATKGAIARATGETV